MPEGIWFGKKYDTDKIQKENEDWYNSIHNYASRWLTYRGKRYRPINNKKIADK